MSDFLTAQALFAHVRALAEDIGPRPTGHPAEAQARAYIRERLQQAGFSADEIEEMPLQVWDTWGYTLVVPLLLSLAGNAAARAGRFGKLIGGLTSLFSAYHLWKAEAGARQPLGFLFPKRPTANLIVRIPAAETPRHRVVLIGHTDTNKNRFTFAPRMKRLLLPSTTLAEMALLANGGVQLWQAFRGAETGEKWRKASLAGLALALPYLLGDELGAYVPGAADNASAVACLLGLGAHLKRAPLKHTEVWLAFTAAEEAGCLGMHALLDAYGDQLKDAWFIDFEMVSTPEIVYVTHHSSLSYLSGYTPDPESLAWARETSRRHPELRVHGRPLVIVEEVGSLRGRGFRGICLAGVGEDGWLASWHRHTDDVAHLDPAGLERAARFALAMLHTLDAGTQP